MNWNVVLDNKEYIDKTCRLMIRNTSLDVEDFIQQVYISVATNYASFDPNRGSFSTFVYWRVMSIKRSCLYRHNKNKSSQINENTGNDYHIEMEYKAELSLLYDTLSKTEKEVVDDMLGKITLDLKYQTKMARLYRLRDRICNEI
ncbi:MAG: sigma factor [Vampirovibrionia bacterium]